MKNKNKKAFTLIEILIGVGIAGLGLIGLYALYSMIEKSNSAQEETNRLISYIEAAKSVASTNGDFRNINIQYLEDYGVNVNRVLGLSEINGSSGDTLNFIYSGMDSGICSKFASSIYSSGIEVDIIIAGKEIDRDLDPITEISSQCASNGIVDLTFSLNSQGRLETLTNENLVPPFNYNSGNPNSLGAQALTLSQYQVVSGQTQSDVQYGQQGTGFAVAGQPAPVYPPLAENNPIATPPLVVPDDPEPGNNNPDDGSSFVLPETDLEFFDSEINFTVDNWDKINVSANGVNVEAYGVLPNLHYKAEFSSLLFALESNNPIILGQEPVIANELTLSERADSENKIVFVNNETVDVSPYFRTALAENEDGSVLTNPNEPMQPALKNFLEKSLKNYPVIVDIIDEASGVSVGKTEIRPEVILPQNTPMDIGDELNVSNGCYYNNNTFAVKWISDDRARKYIVFIHNGQIMKIDDINGQPVVDNYPGWYTTDSHQYYYPYTRLPSSMELAADRYPLLKNAIQSYNMNYKYDGVGGPGHTFVDACFTTPPITNTSVSPTLTAFTQMRPTTATEKLTSGNPEFALLNWNEAKIVLPFPINDIRRVTHSLSGQFDNVSVSSDDLKTYSFKITPPSNGTLSFTRDVVVTFSVVLKNGRRINVSSNIGLTNNKSYITRAQVENNPNYPTCFDVVCYATNPVRPVDGVPGVALPEDVPEIIKRARQLSLENLDIKYSTRNSVLTTFQHVPSRVGMNNGVGIDYGTWRMDRSLFGWEGYPASPSYNNNTTSAPYDLYDRETGRYVGRLNVSFRNGSLHEGIELNKYYSFYLSEVVPNGQSFYDQFGADITYVICLKGKGVYNGTKVVCQP